MTGANSIPDWYDNAACRNKDPRIFFPEQGCISRFGKDICNGNAEQFIDPCPVRTQCLAWALDTNEEYGVWGGMDERERWQLKKAEGKHICVCGDRFATAHGLHSHRNIHCKLRKKAA